MLVYPAFLDNRTIICYTNPMKSVMNGTSFKLIALLAALFGCIIAFIYAFQFLPLEKKLADSSLREELSILVSLYQNPLASALQNADDVSMLKTVDNVMRFDGVSSAYIVDQSGKVITHNKTSEWGKIYADILTKRAIAATSRRIQNTGKPNEFLFSVPLTSSATLCVGLTKEKTEKNIENTRQEYIFTSLIIFLITTIIIFLIVNSLFTANFSRLSRLLKSITLSRGGKLPELKKDEFGKIADEINELLSVSRSLDSTQTDEQNVGIVFVTGEIVKDLSYGLMVIDSQNRIAAANDIFLNFLGMQKINLIGKHVLDAIKMPELLKLLSTISQTPGTALSESINGVRVNGRAVLNDKNHIAGIVLKIA